MSLYLLTIAIPLFMSIAFILFQKMWVIFVFEIYSILMIVIRKKKEKTCNFIPSLVLFSLSILGVCLKVLFTNRYEESILYAAMFIIGLFYFGIMVLIHMFIGEGMIYVKNKNKKE